MTGTLAILTLITLAGAVGAMSLRNLIHCALAAALSFLGLAGVFLELDAQFVGLAQILVYVGAVSILVVFAILLTRGGGADSGPLAVSPVLGIALAGLACGTLLTIILASTVRTRLSATDSGLTTRVLGERLMTEYVLPLELVALLLTAALIGAVLLAMPRTRAEANPSPTPSAPAAPAPGTSSRENA